MLLCNRLADSVHIDPVQGMVTWEVLLSLLDFADICVKVCKIIGQDNGIHGLSATNEEDYVIIDRDGYPGCPLELIRFC